MSYHQHEQSDVYGLDGTRQNAQEALALSYGLREDLGKAEQRIIDLERRVDVLAEACATLTEVGQGALELITRLATAETR